LAALDLLIAQPERVDRLRRNARVLRDRLALTGIDCAATDGHIVPLVVGSSDAAVAASERALERGVFAQAIRPPTVPEGTARLRLAVMATHRASELRQAADVLAAAVEGGSRVSEAAPTRLPGPRAAAAGEERGPRPAPALPEAA
jgi:glycine C-acetyltransferase/8-amino-7-oxononanoate synthase